MITNIAQDGHFQMNHLVEMFANDQPIHKHTPLGFNINKYKSRDQFKYLQDIYIYIRL